MEKFAAAKFMKAHNLPNTATEAASSERPFKRGEQRREIRLVIFQKSFLTLQSSDFEYA